MGEIVLDVRVAQTMFTVDGIDDHQCSLVRGLNCGIEDYRPPGS